MMRLLTLTSLLTVSLAGFAFADVVDLTPTDDAGVYEADQPGNYGDEPDAWVGLDEADEERSLLSFDLSPYAGATVNSATLELYVWFVVDTLDDNRVYLVDEGWDEGSVT